MNDAATIGCTTRPYSALPFAEACARIAAAGYTDVAVFRNQGGMPVSSESTEAEVTAARRALTAAGVRPSMLIGRTQLDLGLDKAIDDYKALIDNAASLGVTWLLDCGTGNEAHFRAYFELMRSCAPYAEQAGLSLTMKPHGGISLTAEDLLTAYQTVDHPAFGICYDPGNIIYYTKGERRPEPDAAQVAGVCNTFIIKDCTVSDGKADVQVTAGDGLVDFGSVIGSFVRAGYQGPYYVECVGSQEPDEVDRDIAFTLGYVRGILAGLASS